MILYSHTCLVNIVSMPLIKNPSLALEVLIVQVIDVGSGHGLPINDPLLDKVLTEIKIILRYHAAFYQTVADQVSPEETEAILNQCFEDGKVNWGRILTSLTLLYVCSEKFKDSYLNLRTLKHKFTKVLLKQTVPWITKRGGFTDYINNRCNHWFCIVLCLVIVVFTVRMLNDASS